MANSRIARFVMEIAPPQFVSVMRQRTKSMLDTIMEEERDNNTNASLSPPSRSSTSSPASAATAASASASSAVIAAACLNAHGSDRYFLTRRLNYFSADE